ncbi:MAG: hypothetical protein V2A67_04035 [Bacteroidota bacterium]
MEIRHLQHGEIDKVQWDRTVLSVHGGSLYGLSWYLDAVSPGWQALATPDYSIIMPMAARKKFGIQYLYQPLLCQQLGVLSAQPLPAETVAAFLESIPRTFRLIEITLHSSNNLFQSPAASQHTTYRLNLSHSYDELSGRYSINTQRNLKKAAGESLTFETGIPAGEYLDLLRQDPGEGSHILLKLKNRKPLLRLITALLAHNSGTICGVRASDGILLCVLLMARQGNSHYYLAPGSTEKGRETRAMFYLVDRYIHRYCGTPASIDFEGSDIPSVARFYEGFGASAEHYFSFRINRLPWPLKKIADRRIK